jgi:hypothetical protein
MRLDDFLGHSQAQIRRTGFHAVHIPLGEAFKEVLTKLRRDAGSGIADLQFNRSRWHIG